MGSRLARRALAATLFALLVIAAVMVPALAFAGTWEEAVDAATALPALPFSVDGTLTAVTFPNGDTDYEYWHTIYMTAGQTISVNATLPAGGYNGFDFDNSDFAIGWLGSDWVDPIHKRLDIMADHTGMYYISMWSSVPGTYTVSAAERGTISYPMSGLTVPKKAKKNRNFSVSVKLSPDYDAIVRPIRFEVQRYKGSKPKKFRTYATKITAGSETYTKFTATLKLAKGKYRVRARFQDARHPLKCSIWKIVTVK